MTKVNIGERCLAGLKCIEDQLRDSSITLEALNSYVNTNIFMSNNSIPSNIDDLILLDTVLNYFNNHKDEQVKRNVFNFLFLQMNDLRKMDFLVKLASLSVTTLSSSMLDTMSVWIKINIPKPLMNILIRRLLTDILSINDTCVNLLKILPDHSISFTAAFLVGITETFQYIEIQPNLDKPCMTLLNHVLEWVRKYKHQLFNQPNMIVATQAVNAIDENRNNPFSGLLFWTLTQPLAKICDGDKVKMTQEDDIISNLHFELLDYLDSRIKTQSSYLLSSDFLKTIVETIKRYETPQTPQSPSHGKEEPVESIISEIDTTPVCLDIVWTRLAGVVQIGFKNDALQSSQNDLLQLLKDSRSHRYINAVLKSMEA